MTIDASFAAVVWDFDGVINDNALPDGFLWQQTLEQDLGVKVSDMREQLFATDWLKIAIGEESLKARVEEILPSTGFTGSTDDFLKYWFDKDLNIDQALIGIVHNLTSSGIPSYLATNQELLRSRHLRQQSVLTHHFQQIFVSAELGVAKPDPAFFRMVGSAIGDLTAEEILFIDDRLENVEAAMEVGWQGIHYRSIDDLKGSLT